MEALAERVLEFIRVPDEGRFARLALEVFSYQYERVPPFRVLCDRSGAAPGKVDDWRRVPWVPAAAFKRVEFAAAPAVETFRSSGATLEEPRSVLHQPYPELLRAVLDAALPAALLPRLERPPMLSLVTARDEAPDSGLSFLVDHLLSRWGDTASSTAAGSRGLDARAARSWLAGRQRQGRPVLLLATTNALLRLVESLERLDLRFRLAPGSRILEAGGFTGAIRGGPRGVARVERAGLIGRAGERLSIPAGRIVRHYGATELTTPFLTRALAGDDPDVFVPPPWTRVRILDPGTLDEAAVGAVGLIAVFDLANLGSVAHVVTDDLGVAEGAGFRFARRAGDTELRESRAVAEALAALGS